MSSDQSLASIHHNRHERAGAQSELASPAPRRRVRREGDPAAELPNDEQTSPQLLGTRNRRYSAEGGHSSILVIRDRATLQVRLQGDRIVVPLVARAVEQRYGSRLHLADKKGDSVSAVNQLLMIAF